MQSYSRNLNLILLCGKYIGFCQLDLRTYFIMYSILHPAIEKGCGEMQDGFAKDQGNELRIPNVPLG